MTTKYTEEQALEKVRLRNYTPRFSHYRGNKFKYPMTCPEGHEVDLHFGDFLRGHGCPICHGTPKKTQEEITQIYATKKIEILETYKGNMIPMKARCVEGHIFKTRLGDFQGGHGCPYCAKVRIQFSDIKKCFDQIQYILDTKEEEYSGLDGRLDYTCDKGHKSHTTWHNFKQGSRCIQCYIDSLRTPLDEIKKYITSENYEFITCKYINAKSVLVLRCPQGHIFNTTWGGFKNSHNRCRKCQTTESKAEQDILAYVKSIALEGTDIDTHNRELCSPNEVDIYIPSFNLAIEYNGLYWHSTARPKYDKDHNIHFTKFKMCQDRNIRLIQIQENEWKEHQEIVKGKLRNLLAPRKSKIYARNCVVKEVPKKAANEFYAKYHIQGAGRNPRSVSYGLYTTIDSKEVLCSVMTFSDPHSYRSPKNKDFKELSRLCSSVYVVGGPEKLFAHYVREHKPNRIISYCDLRWHTGEVYYRLGFKKDKFIKPNYSYIRGARLVSKTTHNKKNLLKEFGADMSKTEAEITKSLKIHRIYDAGKYRFEWKKSLDTTT